MLYVRYSTRQMPDNWGNSCLLDTFSANLYPVAKVVKYNAVTLVMSHNEEKLNFATVPFWEFLGDSLCTWPMYIGNIVYMHRCLLVAYYVG